MQHRFPLNWKAAAIGTLMAGTALSADALTLGRLRGAAWIGQPLDVVVSVELGDAPANAALCQEADVFYADSRQDNSRIRTTLEPTAQPNVVNLRVRSNSLIDEPVVSVYLRAGCGQKVSRRYVMLADYATEASTQSARAITPTAPVVPTITLAPQSEGPASTGAPIAPSASGTVGGGASAATAASTSAAPSPTPSVANSSPPVSPAATVAPLTTAPAPAPAPVQAPLPTPAPAPMAPPSPAPAPASIPAPSPSAAGLPSTAGTSSPAPAPSRTSSASGAGSVAAPLAPAAKQAQKPAPKPAVKAPKPASESTQSSAPKSAPEKKPAPAVQSAPAPKPAAQASSKPAPSTAPKAATDAGKPRLKLDPLDTTAESPNNASAATNAATKPTEPEPSADAQRLEALQGSVKALLEQSAKNEATLLALRERLERAESDRVPMTLVYALAALLIAAMGGLVYLWNQRMRALARTQEDAEEEALEASARAATAGTAAPQPASGQADPT